MFGHSTKTICVLEILDAKSVEEALAKARTLVAHRLDEVAFLEIDKIRLCPCVYSEHRYFVRVVRK